MNKVKVFLMIAAMIWFISTYLGTIKNSIIFLPSNQVVKPNWGNLEDVYLETADNNKINGWFVSSNPGNETILFCHGNAGNISNRTHLLTLFNTLGYNIFIFDYSGYGNSTGSPSEKTAFNDVKASWEYLTGQKGIPANKIIVYGVSLGTSVASWLSQYYQPKCIILQSPFYSLKEMVNAIAPTYLCNLSFLCPEFQTVEFLKNRKSSIPVLIMHSRTDEMIPFSQGKRLYDDIQDPKLFIEMKGGHNDPVLDQEYRENIVSFIGDSG